MLRSGLGGRQIRPVCLTGVSLEGQMRPNWNEMAIAWVGVKSLAPSVYLP